MRVQTRQAANYLKYFLLFLLLNLAFVPIHELGHALIYILEGYQISFHFTKADPVSGVQTLLGASGGLLFNLLFAAAFFFLFKKHQKIVFFAALTSNTLFVRILPDLLKLPSGFVMEDETAIGNLLNVSPILPAAGVWLIFACIFVPATVVLFQSKGSRAKWILVLCLVACVVGLCIMDFLESAGF